MLAADIPTVRKFRWDCCLTKTVFSISANLAFEFRLVKIKLGKVLIPGITSVRKEIVFKSRKRKKKSQSFRNFLGIVAKMKSHKGEETPKALSGSR